MGVSRTGPSKLAWLIGNEALADAILVLHPLTEPGAAESSSEGSQDPTNAAVKEQPASADTSSHTNAVSEPGRKRKSCSDIDSDAAEGKAMCDSTEELPKGVHLPVVRAILASHSDYFKARLSNAWAGSQAQRRDGRLVLAEGLEEDLVAAAEAVVCLMYEEVVRPSTAPEDLVQMCQVADRWGATHCLGYCLDALTQLPDDTLTLDQLSKTVEALPESARLLPCFSAWEDRCMQVLGGADSSDSNTLPILLHLFGDVHALLTNATKLKWLCQLSFPAIKAWAGSDDLVVESENSVAVALGAWVEAQAAPGRQECSKEQKEELSGLLRVKHLSPGFLLYQVPHLTWFTDTDGSLACFTVACMTGSDPCVNQLYSWSSPPRKQLPAAVLRQRASIAWDVPRADLQKHLAQEGGELHSPTIYVAGTGVQLCLWSHGDSPCQIGLFVLLPRYELDGRKLTTEPSFLSCKYATSRLAPDEADPVQVVTGMETLRSDQGGWGDLNIIPLPTSPDLDSYLVDGHLKLRLDIEELL